MGCDIHMYIEYKIPFGKWTADKHHKEVIINDTCEDTYNKKTEYEHWCEPCKNGESIENCHNGYKFIPSVDADGRDYGLFGKLASVRGRSSREAKGLPDNVSFEIAHASEMYGSDGHSHSYISLDEFKKVLFDESNYKPTDITEAFYNWQNYKGDYDSRPPAFTTIVAYCEQLKEILNVDRIILDDKDLSSPIKVRLVFWFDN